MQMIVKLLYRESYHREFPNIRTCPTGLAGLQSIPSVCLKAHYPL